MTSTLPNKIRLSIAIIATTLLAVGNTGCTKHMRAAAHLKRGNDYFKSGHYSEAEIEFKNVLQIDGLNPDAIAALGMIYYNEGDPGKAGPYLLKGRQLRPDNLELRLKVGQFLLESGDTKDARDEANYVLKGNPSDPDAPMLLADASSRTDEIEASRRVLVQLPPQTAASPAVLVALGVLDLRQKRIQDAESSVEKALLSDPNSSVANFAMGALFQLRNDTAKAEQSFKVAATHAPARSSMRIKYAQFKILNGDLHTGQQLLEEMTHDTPDYMPASMLLAEIYLAQGNLPGSESIVTKLLQSDGTYPQAMILSARINLKEGKTSEAIAGLTRMQEEHPKSAPACYLLAQAYLFIGDTGKAVDNLSRAIAINPNLSDPVVLLAKTDMRLGDFKSASVLLAQLLQRQPGLLEPRLLQAELFRTQGDLGSALGVYRELEVAQPKNPEIPLFTGVILDQLNRRDEARESFNKALEVSPTYLPAMEQLINLDLLQRNYSAALEMANRGLESAPKSDLPQLFFAKIYLAQKDFVRAETALHKAIELKPDAPTAYFLLAQIYEATHRNDKAIDDLKEVVRRNPKDTRALMMMGIIYNGQGNYAASRDTYEKLLEINPNFSSALNNLAWLYSEKFNELEKGFEMAQKARELLPNEPHVADTLGWIVYKERKFGWARDLLQESASRLQTEPEIQYHLGKAYYMLGEEEPARAAFQRALKLMPGFPDSDDVKKCLSTLALNVDGMSDLNRSAAEKTLSDRTDDPVAQVRLAAMYERDGSIAKAESGYQAALKLNPENITAMLNLVRLYSSQREIQKAMDLAKEVHKLAPNDPEVSQALGRVAYRTGYYTWAYSLLQDALKAKPEDPVALFDMANASFSVGKLTEAEETMRHAVNAGLAGSQSDDAVRFLKMSDLFEDSDKAAQEVSLIDQILESDPNYGPAVEALAGADEARHNPSAAIKDYEKVLSEYPDFSPAIRRLAILYSADPSQDEKTLNLAVKAREIYPDDAELEKALGIAVYRNKDFERAAVLFQESLVQRNNDADLYYYLGMSRYQLKDAAASRRALQRALDLGLQTDLAALATKALIAEK